MTVTVSNEKGVEQYNIPDNIKKIIILCLLLLTSIVIGLSFSIKTLSEKLVQLEENINIERIVEKSKDTGTKDIPAYELAMFEANTLEEEVLKNELDALKFKQEQVLLVKLEQEKQEALAKIDEEKQKKEALALAENQREEKLAKSKVKAEKFARIRLDTAMLVNAEQTKKDKLINLEKLKIEKKEKISES